MESREVLLNLIILIVIISAIILTNGCSGSVQVDGGDGFTIRQFNGGFLGIGGLAKRKLICHLLDENSAMILQMGVYFAPEITARWLGVKKEKM